MKAALLLELDEPLEIEDVELLAREVRTGVVVTE